MTTGARGETVVVLHTASAETGTSGPAFRAKKERTASLGALAERSTDEDIR